MIVEFEDEALAEIENAISYSEGRFGTGERLNCMIQSTILRIAEDPFRFRKNHLGVCSTTFRLSHFTWSSSPARIPRSSGSTPWETPPAAPATGSHASFLRFKV